MTTPGSLEADDTDELPTGVTMLGEPRPARDAPPAARLVVLAGAVLGRRHPLAEVSTIGRVEGQNVVLADPSVSRRHAVLRARGAGAYEIEDLASANGTFVNGERITGRAPLRFGDRLQLGRVVALFTHVDPLEEEILQRQKLEAIGRLGAGMAHDVNNLLGGVLSNADYLLGLDGARTLGEPAVIASLGDLRAAARQAAEFTQRILSFARRSSGEHAQVDLTLLLLDTIAIARRSMERSILIERSVAPGVNVRGERSALQQMLMSLLLSARDAMPHGGTLRVELRHAAPGEVDQERVALGASHARLVVRDTGSGTGAARAPQAPPAATLSTPALGASVDLGTAAEIVGAHGGTLESERQPGGGNERRVVLPALVAAGREERPTPLEGTPRSQARPTRSASILLVDDEPLSRRGVVRLLERDGHRVIAAEDGPQALALFEKDPAAIDVALLDLDLPGMDGQRVQSLLRARAPALPILFLSGFVADARRRELLAAGALAVLQKPCEVATLREALRSALAAPPRSA